MPICYIVFHVVTSQGAFSLLGSQLHQSHCSAKQEHSSGQTVATLVGLARIC